LRTGEIIIDFSKAFSSVPHDRLLTEIAATGVDLRVVVWVKEFVLGRSVVVWVKEFVLGRSQRVRVDGQLYEEFRVT
jgi:hypothetical protein